ncbi:unnamed protein product [Aphanomyces euteiches]
MGNLTSGNTGPLAPKVAKTIFVTDDGSVGISYDYAQQYVKHMPLEVKLPVVTPRHIALIKANWSAITVGTSAFDPAKHGSPDKFFHRTFYSLFFAVLPTARNIFRSSMNVQGKSLASIIKVLTGVANVHTIGERMQALAMRHLKYGCAKSDYTAMGVTLFKTLEIVSGDEWSWQVKEAYLTAYCFLFYLMLPVLINHEPDPIPDDLPATVIAVDVFGSVRRVTLSYNFPLRFLPGEGVVLGIPEANGTETRKYFPIASFSPKATHTLDILVDQASSAWLGSRAIGATCNLYYVESNICIDVEDVEALPEAPLFVSYGAGCAPFMAMIQALHSVQNLYRGNVVALQCGSSFDEAAALARGYGDLSRWPNCTVQYDMNVTPDLLANMVPQLSHRTMYVCGPPEFVSMAEKAFVVAGGRRSRVRVYTYDSSKLRVQDEIVKRGLIPAFEVSRTVPRRTYSASA